MVTAPPRGKKSLSLLCERRPKSGRRDRRLKTDYAPGTYCGDGGGVARSRNALAKASVSSRLMAGVASPGLIAARARAFFAKPSGSNSEDGLASAMVSITDLSRKVITTALRHSPGVRVSLGAVGISANRGKARLARAADVTSPAIGEVASTGVVSNGLSCAQPTAIADSPVIRA